MGYTHIRFVFYEERQKGKREADKEIIQQKNNILLVKGTKNNKDSKWKTHKMKSNVTEDNRVTHILYSTRVHSWTISDCHSSTFYFILAREHNRPALITYMSYIMSKKIGHSVEGERMVKWIRTGGSHLSSLLHVILFQWSNRIPLYLKEHYKNFNLR